MGVRYFPDHPHTGRHAAHIGRCSGSTVCRRSKPGAFWAVAYRQFMPALLKLLYMGIQNASKKWTMPLQNWNLALSQLAIFFKGRLDDALEL